MAHLVTERDIAAEKFPALMVDQGREWFAPSSGAIPPDKSRGDFKAESTIITSPADRELAIEMLGSLPQSADLNNLPMGRYITSGQVQRGTESLDKGRIAPELSGFYSRPTLEDVARYAYGDEKYAPYIKESNILQKEVGSERLLNDTFFCPPINIPLSDVSKFAPNVREVVSEGAWVAEEKAIAESYRDGLSVVIFPRQKSGTHVRIRGIVSIASRSSYFEASRAVELSWPADMNSDPYVNLYGNHIACAYNGEAFFMGILTLPEVDSNKGITMTWAAQSHTYYALTTHFNPQTIKSDMQKMGNLDMIKDISNDMNIPIKLGKNADAYEAMAKAIDYDNSEENGLKNSNFQDIEGTTPVKMIQKICEPTRLWVTATVEGTLLIDLVDINMAPAYTYVQGDPVRGRFDIEVKYNYGELAKTYSYFSHRRAVQDGQAEQAIFEGFPLPIFRNVVRSSVGVIGGGAAAAKESAKALAQAVNIDLILDEWENPSTGKLWKYGETVRVYSPVYGLADSYTDDTGGLRQMPAILVVSGVSLERTKDWKRCKLSLCLPGVFAPEYPRTLPFLTGPNEALKGELNTVNVDPQALGGEIGKQIEDDFNGDYEE